MATTISSSMSVKAVRVVHRFSKSLNNCYLPLNITHCLNASVGAGAKNEWADDELTYPRQTNHMREETG